jgi:PII-like signaling protein
MEDKRLLSPGPAQRVVIHLNEDEASGGDYLHVEIVSFLFARGVSGATVLRGHAGFGIHHRIHTHGAPGTGGEHLPIRVEFLESAQTVEGLMPRLIELVTDGVIEVQTTRIVHVAQSAHSREREGRTG